MDDKQTSVAQERHDPPTATDVLIRTLEHFGESEPGAVLVIYNTDEGMVIESNANSAEIVGICEIAKCAIIDKMRCAQ